MKKKCIVEVRLNKKKSGTKFHWIYYFTLILVKMKEKWNECYLDWDI